MRGLPRLSALVLAITAAFACSTKSVSDSGGDGGATAQGCEPDPCAGKTGTVCRNDRCVTGTLEVSRDTSGKLTGTYTSVGSSKSVRFGAKSTADDAATATYEADGAGPIAVELTAKDTVKITVAGASMDGKGALTAAEQKVVDALSVGDLAAAIARVPMELGCQTTDATPAELAALVAPYQAFLKYGTTTRTSDVKKHAEQVSCRYFSPPAAAIAAAPTGLLRLSNDDPHPNVFGIFPFDDVGAKTATTTKAYVPNGPCGSACRGACGPDCTSANCKQRDEYKCVTDGNEARTGEKMHLVIQNCGVAAGCDYHDQCYDACATKWGCDQYALTTCMHGVPAGCDLIAIAKYGFGNCSSWARGGGPFDARKDFTFLGETTTDLSMCPAQGAVSGGVNGVFPEAEPFNGLQIQYGFSGGSVTGAPVDKYDFTTSRAYAGKLGQGPLTLKATGSCGWGYGCTVTGTVCVDGDCQTDSIYLPIEGSTAVTRKVDLTVPALPGAKEGTFSMRLVGDYNVGTRTLVVSGTFKGAAAASDGGL